MKICMIAPEQLPVPCSNSVEICMLSIAKQLVKQHQVTIVSRVWPGKSRDEVINGVRIVRVPASSTQVYTSSVITYLRDRQFDLIQVDNRPHLMAAVKRTKPQTPVSLFLHSLTFVPKTSKVTGSLRFADIVIVNSQSLKSQMIQRFPSQASKIKRVYLGVDVLRFKPVSSSLKTAAKKKLHLKKNPVVVYVGRVIPRKGIHVLIQSMAKVRKKLPHAKLVVAGKSRKMYFKRLKTLARKYRVPVLFRGHVPHQKLPHIYHAADCFVCPSQKHEAFGLVNVEAMAAGIPIVASRNGGIKEIVVHRKNGYLVRNYKQPQAFARSILKILTRPALARRYSLQSRKIVLRKFTWKQTAKSLHRRYLSMKRNK